MGVALISVCGDSPQTKRPKARLKLEIKDDTRTQAEVVRGSVENHVMVDVLLSQKKDLIHLVLTLRIIFGRSITIFDISIRIRKRK
jgi:hypothetical protein